jgi:hypothetical protein
MELTTDRRAAVFLVFTALAGVTPLLPAGLRKVADIDARKIIEAKGVSHTPDLPVLALRFSPDGRKLAAIIDRYGERGKETSLVLVLDTPPIASVARLFEVKAGVDENDDDGPSADFGWSPSGEILNVGGGLIHLLSGAQCELPYASVLVSDRLAIGTYRINGVSIDLNSPASHFTLFDTACHPTATWDINEKWSIGDVSPDRGLLSIVKETGLPNKTVQLIVDPLKRTVTHQWSGAERSGARFANGGNAICAGSDPELAERAPVTCWATDSGEKINEAPTANGGDPIAPSLHASRIVVSDYRRRKLPLSSEFTSIFKGRVIWDFMSGKELVSWRPPSQSWDFHLFLDASRPPKRVTEPFRFAISSDGEYIAEGGNGIIHLYKIEP